MKSFIYRHPGVTVNHRFPQKPVGELWRSRQVAQAWGCHAQMAGLIVKHRRRFSSRHIVMRQRFDRSILQVSPTLPGFKVLSGMVRYGTFLQCQ